jgi:hypothetical protein
MLDADAAAAALTMIFNPPNLPSATADTVAQLQQYSPSHILNTYNDARRKVFQLFVDPTSTQNKIRATTQNPDQATEDDWLFRELKLLETKPTMARAQRLMKPFFEGWRTDMLQEVNDAWE